MAAILKSQNALPKIKLAPHPKRMEERSTFAQFKPKNTTHFCENPKNMVTMVTKLVAMATTGVFQKKFIKLIVDKSF